MYVVSNTQQEAEQEVAKLCDCLIYRQTYAKAPGPEANDSEIRLIYGLIRAICIRLLTRVIAAVGCRYRACVEA